MLTDRLRQWLASELRGMEAEAFKPRSQDYQAYLERAVRWETLKEVEQRIHLMLRDDTLEEDRHGQR